jgi:hypothetical protein
MTTEINYSDASDARIDEIVACRLSAYYLRNGYVRRQNEKRKTREGHKRYKKGGEVRLLAKSIDELRCMRLFLKMADFKPGLPFSKGRQYCQPIYGKQEVERFLQMVNSVSNDE